jgi:hypothetical protein
MMFRFDQFFQTIFSNELDWFVKLTQILSLRSDNWINLIGLIWPEKIVELDEILDHLVLLFFLDLQSIQIIFGLVWLFKEITLGRIQIRVNWADLSGLVKVCQPNTALLYYYFQMKSKVLLSYFFLMMFWLQVDSLKYIRNLKIYVILSFWL